MIDNTNKPVTALESGGSAATPGQTQAAARKPARWGWLLAGFLLLAVAAVIGLRLHNSLAQPKADTGRAAAANQAIHVTLATVKQGDIGEYVSGIGIVTPVYTVSVKSRVDGQLFKVNYEEGQLVKAGDPLLEIDPAPYEAMLEQAQGQWLRDTAQLTNALIDLKRYQEALSRNAIPEQQLATQKATVAQDEGLVQFDQGQIDSAKVNLAYCHITSPISGRVGLRLVDPGNIVHASDANALVVIAQIKPITTVFTIAEDYLPRILPQLRQGQKLVVEAYDRAKEQKLATGAVLTIDNEIDVSSGTIKIKALFDNDDESLYPNQFVNARLLVDTHHGALLVPTQTIQRNAEGPFVYLVQPDQTGTNQIVTMKPVTLQTADANAGVSAVEGLKLGEVIAADNFNRLQDGVKVVARQTQKADDHLSGESGKHRGGS